MTQTPENAWKEKAPRIVPRFGVLPATITPGMEKTRLADRKAALKAGNSEFTAICAIHGSTLFDAPTGACLSCVAEKSELPVRLAYGSSYAVAFPMPCERHGDDALAHYPSNRCTQCYDARGRPLAERSARAVARSAGEKLFRSTCPTHGETDHYVSHGRCADCYTSAGAVRVGNRP